MDKELEFVRSLSTQVSNLHGGKLEALDQNRIFSATIVEQSEWRALGLQLLAKGQVGVILLAGGQGTRLGSDKPKGMYDLGLGGGETLFSLQAKQILKLESECGHSLTWYIMVSAATESETKGYFEQNQFWGLNKENIVFFCQADLPVLDLQGQALYDDGGYLIRAPAGNGSLYKAMKDSFILEHAEQRGIKYFFQYGVDNVLVKIADPIALGCASLFDLEILSKGVKKDWPEESLGQILQNPDGKIQVIEYSEIEPNLSASLFASGYPGGHTCINIFDLNFLKDVLSHIDHLPYHAALKKVPHVGNPQPCTANALKYELFLFDIFPLTKRFGLFQVDREFEFAPLKNGPGAERDSPEDCRKKYLKAVKAFV